MTINPYLPPRAPLTNGDRAWRANPYWRFGNWLYGVAMLIGLLFVIRGGSLTPEPETLVTLLVFLAPIVGYYVSVSASAEGAYKLWRIAHLGILCFLLWLVIDDAVKGMPTPVAGWLLITVTVVSIATNAMFHRHKKQAYGTRTKQ